MENNVMSFDALNMNALSRIEDELRKKGIRGLESKLNYVSKNYCEQVYINYALFEIQDIIAINYSDKDKEFKFKSEAIDGILRALYFFNQNSFGAMDESGFKYVKSKIVDFEHELLKQYKEDKVV